MNHSWNVRDLSKDHWPLRYLDKDVTVAFLEAVGREKNLIEIGDLVFEFAQVDVDVVGEISYRVYLVLFAFDQRLNLLKSNRS